MRKSEFGPALEKLCVHRKSKPSELAARATEAADLLTERLRELDSDAQLDARARDARTALRTELPDWPDWPAAAQCVLALEAHLNGGLRAELGPVAGQFERDLADARDLVRFPERHAGPVHFGSGERSATGVALKKLLGALPK